MRKSDELSSPLACMAKARWDEMTFVLLARDPAAPTAIRHWISRRIELGLNQPDDPKLREAEACAQIMEAERGIATLPGEPPKPPKATKPGTTAKAPGVP